jgi:hypothetical protein
MNAPLVYPEARVRKLPLHDFYMLGKQLTGIASVNSDAVTLQVLPPLFFARQALDGMLGPMSPLLGTSRRAAMKLRSAIAAVIPEDFNDIAKIPDDEKVNWSRSNAITTAYTELESVLGNDLPGVAAYLVSQKGIYNTDDLIGNAECQLVEEIRSHLPENAKTDIREAGKCLAYDLPTACAFHLWRAVETVMEGYYKKLTGKTFEEAKVQRTWYQYIKALEGAKADSKVTGFLDHIREKYRNPTAHPTEFVDPSEAQGLFGVAFSSIDQMISATIKLPTPSPATATGSPQGIGA